MANARSKRNKSLLIAGSAITVVAVVTTMVSLLLYRPPEDEVITKLDQEQLRLKAEEDDVTKARQRVLEKQREALEKEKRALQTRAELAAKQSARRVEQLAILREHGSITEALLQLLESLDEEWTDWSEEIEPLLTNEAGRRLAKSPHLVSDFDRLYSSIENPTDDHFVTARRVSVLQQQLKDYLEPIQTALADSADPYTPSEPYPYIDLRDDLRQTRQTIEEHAVAISLLLERAPPEPGTMTLADAVSRLKAQARLADASREARLADQAERLNAEMRDRLNESFTGESVWTGSIDSTKVTAEFSSREQELLTGQFTFAGGRPTDFTGLVQEDQISFKFTATPRSGGAKLDYIFTGQLSSPNQIDGVMKAGNHERDLTLNRLDDARVALIEEATRPEVHQALAPLMADGHWQPHIRRPTPEKGPISLSGLEQASHGFAPGQLHGVLNWSGNDRPLGLVGIKAPRPEQRRQRDILLQKMSEYLQKYGQILVEEGYLAP